MVLGNSPVESAGSEMGSVGLASTLQEVSYWLLACVVVLHSIALKGILRETLWLKRRYCLSPNNSKGNALASFIEMPQFRARLLGSEKVLTDKDCRGRATLFLFVDAMDALALRREVFDGTVYALWGKAEECLYIVCNGTSAQCSLLQDRYSLRERYGETIQILLNESSTLAEIFDIASTPSAIIFDENGVEEKRGYLSPQYHIAQGEVLASTMS